MLSSYVRGDFPGLARFRAYLNTAAEGLVPRPARDALVRHLMLFSEDPVGVGASLPERLEEAGRLVERAYGLPASGLAWGESTTHMIVRAAMTALAASGGGGVAVTPMEFPGVTYALASACRRAGCRLVVAEGEGSPEEALVAAVENGASVVVASSVFWVTGYALDVPWLARRVERLGGFLVVDAIQHLGALPSTQLAEADAACASPKKWLLAPHSSTALCYVGRRLIEAPGAEPPWYSLNNVDLGDRQRFWLDPWKRISEPPPPSRSPSMLNAPSGLHYLSAAALEETLRYLSMIPVEAVYEHILRLRRHLVDLLEDEGLGVHPVPKGRESEIVLVETGLPPERELALARELASRGVAVSARGQAGVHGIRVSLHLYNSLRDVEVFVEELARLAR